MTDPLHDNVIDALYELQQEVGPLARDAANPFYSSHFSSFPGIKAIVDPIAWKHGLVVRQSLRTAPDGSDVLRNRLYFNGQLEDDEDITMHLPGVTPQAHGSATTFYRRYAYTTCLGLVSETDDDDGNKASVPTQQQTVRREPPAIPPVAAKAESIAASHAPQDRVDEEF